MATAHEVLQALHDADRRPRRSIEHLVQWRAFGITK
jgi:hypothetical protein